MRGAIAFLPRVAMLFGLVATSSSAASIVITLEAYPGPDGVLGTADDVAAPNAPNCGVFCFFGLLRNQFSDIGVVFSSGTLFQGVLFPNSTASNHFISSSPPDATFSIPVYGISVESYSGWSAALYGFDSSNQLIATDILINPHPGTALFGTLSISTAQPISRFAVRPESCGIVGDCTLILNLDNITLTTVAEPPYFWLVSAVLCLFPAKLVGRRQLFDCKRAVADR